MKNFFLSLGLVVFGCGLVSARSEYADSTGESDALCVGVIYTSGVSTDALCVDAQGTITPLRNLTNNIGSSRVRYRTAFLGDLDVASGTVNIVENFTNLTGENLTGMLNVAIATGILIRGGSTFIGVDLVQTTGAPRNLTLYFSSDSVSSGVGVFSTTTLVGSATFYGYDNKGNYTTEVILFSTASVSLSSSS